MTFKPSLNAVLFPIAGEGLRGKQSSFRITEPGQNRKSTCGRESDRWKISVFLFVVLSFAVFSQGCAGPVQAKGTADPPPPATPVDSQLSACNSAACNVQLAAGDFTFSTQIHSQTTIHISGAGASYNNAGPHCMTTLTWTGGGSIPFVFDSYTQSGSQLYGFCLNATGAAPPVFIDVDQSAGDVHINDIVIDTPTTKAQIAAIRWGNTAEVAAAKCTDVFIRAAAPIGYDVLDVGAHFMGLRCRGVWNDEHEWVIGDSGHMAESFHCVFCTAEASSGNTPVVILNAKEFSWSEGYTEGEIAFDIPASATKAEAVTISNNWASGGGDNKVSAMVRSALPTATVTVSGNEIIGDGYIVEDDMLAKATVIGNSMPGAAVAKNGGKVCAFGNAATLAGSKPATGFCN